MNASDLEEVVRRYGDSVYRVALQYTKSPADAEDILQETLLERWRTDKAFESDEHERRWLLRVAVNKCRNAWRRHRRANVVSLEEVGEEPRYEPDGDAARALYDAVRALPRSQRMAVDLYYGEGYAAGEIASILNVREATVRTWLFRARKKLKNLLKED